MLKQHILCIFSYRNNCILCTQGRIHRYTCLENTPRFGGSISFSLGLGCVSPRRLVFVTVVSPVSWHEDITCWCPTRCPTSRRSRTCRTPESKRVEEGSPASFCPDWRVAFPGAWCCCPLILMWWQGRPPPTCSASSSELECSGCLAPCRWGLCLRGSYRGMEIITFVWFVVLQIYNVKRVVKI